MVFGVQELIVLGVLFGLAVVVPATVVAVVVYCVRRDSPNQRDA